MKEWQAGVDRMIATARKYPQFCQYMQPGNEPPCDEGYYTFHNFMASAMIKATPDLKVIGPNAPFNLSAPDEQGMREFLAKCGANTDVLCWHIYGRSPESVVAQARYWSKEADGKLRGKGPVKVM